MKSLILLQIMSLASAMGPVTPIAIRPKQPQNEASHQCRNNKAKRAVRKHALPKRPMLEKRWKRKSIDQAHLAPCSFPTEKSSPRLFKPKTTSRHQNVRRKRHSNKAAHHLQRCRRLPQLEVSRYQQTTTTKLRMGNSWKANTQPWVGKSKCHFWRLCTSRLETQHAGFCVERREKGSL